MKEDHNDLCNRHVDTYPELYSEEQKEKLRVYSEQAERMHLAFASLAHHEREIAIGLVDRIAVGQRRHGRLDPPKDLRNWEKEALEELLDRLVYGEIARYTARVAR